MTDKASCPLCGGSRGELGADGQGHFLVNDEPCRAHAYPLPLPRKPDKKLLGRWCFEDEYSNDATLSLFSDGSAQLLMSREEVAIPRPVIDGLVECAVTYDLHVGFFAPEDTSDATRREAVTIHRASQADVLYALGRDPRGPMARAMDLDPFVAMPVYADWFGRYVPGFGWVMLGHGIVYHYECLTVTL